MSETFSYQNWLLNKVKERLDYDKYTGIFTWKDGKNKGQRAGCYKNINDYTEISVVINKRKHSFRANRLAWYFVYGRMPLEGLEIDHKDGVRSNDKIDNLQEVTHEVNMQLAVIRRVNGHAIGQYLTLGRR